MSASYPDLPLSDQCGVSSTDSSGVQRSPTDVLFLLSMGCWVFIMQSGFALLEMGGTRWNHSVNILMKNMADVIMTGLAWFLFGWAFAFGRGNGFIGWNQFAAQDMNDVIMWFYQFTFVANACTIDSGCIAERMDLLSYMAASFFMCAWTYPLVAHWVWSEEGWLRELDFVDLAGSSVVHLVGGISGLLMTWWIGPRTGRFDASDDVGDTLQSSSVVPSRRNPDHQESFRATSAHLLIFGTMILWTGWYGFTIGSVYTLQGGSQYVAAHVALTTTLAACAGGLTGALMSFRATRRFPVGDMCNGILAGLVAITCQAHAVAGWASIVIGSLGAVGALKSRSVFVRLRIDDPIDAVAVHGVGGIVGILSSAFFLTTVHCGAPIADDMQGILYGGGRILWVQLRGLLVIMAWTAVNTLLFLVAWQKFGRPFRVSVVDEIRGLDFSEHGIDGGRQLLQEMRQLFFTVATLNPMERTMMREIALSFLQPAQAQYLKSENHSPVVSAPNSPPPEEALSAPDVQRSGTTASHRSGRLVSSRDTRKATRFLNANDSMARSVALGSMGPVGFLRQQALQDMISVLEEVTLDQSQPEDARAHARNMLATLRPQLAQVVHQTVMTTSAFASPLMQARATAAMQTAAEVEALSGRRRDGMRDIRGITENDAEHMFGPPLSIGSDDADQMSPRGAAVVP